jgi:hypothetical protein
MSDSELNVQRTEIIPTLEPGNGSGGLDGLGGGRLPRP